MSATDRFVRQATRGLWGQKRRDAQLELRGAVEDKVYRYGLCGLSPEDAERAALRDLGRPGAIARDLSRVHSVPVALRGALALGVAGLLSLQAAAQVGTVQAILDPRMAPACTLEELYVQLVPGATAAATQRLQATPAGRAQVQASVLGRLPADEAAHLRSRLNEPGGLEALVSECRQNMPSYAANLLRLDDVLSALEAGGVTITSVQGAEMFQVSFPGEEPFQGVNLEYSTQRINGATYVNGGVLLMALKRSVTVPLMLSGLRNPTLTVGPARLQLGTDQHPVLLTDLLGPTVLDQLSPLFPQARGQLYPALTATPSATDHRKVQPQVQVKAADGTLYAAISNVLFLHKPQSPTPPLYVLSIQALHGGRFTTASIYESPESATRLVDTVRELLAATARGERALLVYRLDGSDLHRLTLTPMPAAQLRMAQP
ncbi:hypothetical protein [Deinococcus aquaedulcis]|uniref:hypothetical protein n=1 Tax=Deinococcus aquaedulcis TaxID=2840455 RepID=UPI001C82F99C|nr:hypothetical protein [Deinococcus aquaedulcis]